MEGDFKPRRYRLCARCGLKWNVSCCGPSPRRYVCPRCERALRRPEGKPAKR